MAPVLRFAAPVARMLSAPSLHAVHMFRPPEVIVVFRILKPSTLAVDLAGLAALWLATVVLPILVARVGNEQPMAMTAFLRLIAGIGRGLLPVTVAETTADENGR